MVAIERRNLRDFDWLLAFLAIAIVGFGTWQIRNAQPTETFWVKQLIGLGIALVAMLAVAFTDYRRLLNIAPAFYVFGLVLLVVVLKAATSGLVVLQVRGGLGTATPKVSIAVAVMDTLPPLFIVIEFPAWLWPPIWRWMAWIRQVAYGKGLLVVPETLAKRLAMPGDLAVALAWLRTLG